MNRTSPHSTGGFTLIEVLVALLVLSFGVLAALGLQIVAASNVQNSSQRVLATNLANDLLSRIRANFDPTANATYLLLTEDVEMGNGHFSSKPSPDCGDYGTVCTPQQLATFDLWQWEQRLDGHYQTTPVGGDDVVSGGLVDPTACLYMPSGGGSGFYQLVIVWRSATESENPIFSEANIDDCGNTTDRYGTDNVHRRVLSMTTFISEL